MSIDIPTTVTNNNERLSIHEWLNKIPDFQQRSLFINIQTVNTNELELQCLTTNLSIAKKWAGNARIHISRILVPIQLSSVFTEYEDLYHDSSDIDVWNPPPPPIIEFIHYPSQARTSQNPDNNSKKSTTQNKPNNNKSKTVTYKSVTEADNHTVTTVNTQESYIQDTLSYLQNMGQQHQQVLDDLQTTSQRHQQLLDQHSTTVTETNETLKTHVSKLNSRLATLEKEQQVQQRHHERLQADSLQHSNDIQILTSNLDEQQKQLNEFVRKQNKINHHKSKHTGDPLTQENSNIISNNDIYSAKISFIITKQRTSYPT
jgi:hypothetical protein